MADAGKKLDEKLTGTVDKSKSKQGGFDFSSDLRKGDPRGHIPKRNGGKDVQTLDVTGIEALAGFSSGPMNINSGTLMDKAETVKGAVTVTIDYMNATIIEEQANSKTDVQKPEKPEDIYNISYDKKTQNYHYQKKEANEVKKQNE